MGGRFCLPCFSEQGVALLSIWKFAGGFPRFSRKSLQPLVERYAVLSSIALGHDERLLAYPPLMARKSAIRTASCR